MKRSDIIKKKVEIWGNGSAKRDFIYAEDFTNSLIELTNKYNSTKPLNICTGKQYSIKSISNSLKKISGFKGKIFWNEPQLFKAMASDWSIYCCLSNSP